MTQLLINISRKQAMIYAVFLVLYEFLTYIANDMIMPGMINVVNSFHGPESAIATSLTLYVLGGASLQLLLGPISDKHGRRPVMIFGACLFFLCTVFIACSYSMDQFLLARFFQGMGLCFISVVGYATLQEIFAEMEAIRLISIMANVAILAPLVGPLLGALFIYYYNWRMIFVLIGLLALVALWGLWRFMPESVGQIGRDGKITDRGSLSFSAVATNYKKLVLNRSFILGSIAMGLIYLPCMAWIALSPIILVKTANLTIIQYGLWQLPVFGTFILGNICLHRMTHYHNVRKLVLIGSVIASFSLLFVFILPMLGGNEFLWLMPGLLVYFFGAGLIGAPLARYILFCTDVSKGTASGLMCTISMSAQALGIELGNAMYSTHDNIFFGLYCALSAVIYLIFLWGSLFNKKEIPSE